LRSLILDRRRFPTRLAHRLWDRWAEQSGHLLELLERGTAAASSYYLARRVRRRPPPPLRPYLISVGNLRVGGTGKTPVVLALAQTLAQRGYTGAVLTRGYGSRLAGPLVVRPENPSAADEARLLAGCIPDWTVVQARRRYLGLQHVLDRHPPPEVLIVEDGYQTAGVPRHLDLLILDCWRREGVWVYPTTGRVLPWGPYREAANGAERADIWLLESALEGEGSEPPLLQEPPAFSEWRGIVGERQVPVVVFKRRMRWSPTARLQDRSPYGVLAGVARPEAFERGCARLIGCEPRLVARYDDHQAYSRPEVDRLLRAGRQAGVVTWLTTAKDGIKLARIWPAEPPLQVVELTIEWGGNKSLPDLIEERLALAMEE